MENGSKAIAPEPPALEPALPALRRRYPEADDEEFILRHAFPEALVEAMLAEPPDETDYSRADRTLVSLIEAFARHSAHSDPKRPLIPI